jgi:hypothetical protein
VREELLKSKHAVDGNGMKRKTKPSAKKYGRGTLLMALAAVLFVAILLLRLLVFVTPHERHHF